jgi:phosphoribosylglycinamide formyltransferase 1
MKNIVVLISGSGSNLQALIGLAKKHSEKMNIAAVISNNPDAYGLQRAKEAGIEAVSLSHRDFETREAFDQVLMKAVETYQPDLIVLAGFMRILTDAFVSKYLGKLINIHPSLLPKYPGLNTHSRVLAAGDELHGASIHFVTSELDGGPLIHQAAFHIEDNDIPDILKTKVQQLEHVIYPQVVEWFIDERLELKGNQAMLDGEPIHPN